MLALLISRADYGAQENGAATQATTLLQLIASSSPMLVVLMPPQKTKATRNTTKVYSINP